MREFKLPYRISIFTYFSEILKFPFWYDNIQFRERNSKRRIEDENRN